MIKIEIPSEKDKICISNLLYECKYKEINLDEKINNSMAVYDGNDLIGFASYIYVEDDNMGIIDIIAVKEEFRGQYIGDGLIKALLNLADKRGISKIYVISDSVNSLFFKKVGFTKRNGSVYKNLRKYLSLNYDEGNIEIFEAKLPDFFNKSCKSNL
ncbi:N-acetylglutamate synthase, GNAT family [Caminicella sporogenes DSM 14501]|uniref:N-acetylglutamate synthase, GNAT family n=1 Tax=Caminicella sporogenes DSM 14501 TaxID=1121266 RepID=A0A1M6L420_9FIRM|nr:GNAT family N-acetyltransferase [Caminicella sporogenes]RKD27697.1 hypothetical protein BET04_01125 [Caminicella sporogenes]SHJ65948.1 N-acetylglutamate synthase, GNAT family [Caminicella sporogenes DSM 14501]